MRQVISLLDAGRSGFIQRADLSQVVRGLCESISLGDVRVLLDFLDERGTGKIQITEFIRMLQDILNHQIGGGIYAFMQVQPVLRRIINGLAIDADKFFDEIAYKNEQYVPENAKLNNAASGLNKKLFFTELHKYGVDLSE
jgi:hypothetical protein